jgi:glycosyltransferase involved in cell wall biosynthesis
MEALAMEVAVVAPSVAGIPELVEHERSGLLFAPSHWDGLRTQLERLLSDANLRARLGSEGRRRVEAEFDSDKAVRPLVERFATPS